MTRTTINLDPDRYSAIKDLADKSGTTAAQLLREGAEIILALRDVSQYDIETIRLLQKKYPRMLLGEIVRELMFQWRLRSEGGNTKDNRLADAVDILKDLQQGQRSERELLSEILSRLATNTTIDNDG